MRLKWLIVVFFVSVSCEANYEKYKICFDEETSIDKIAIENLVENISKDIRNELEKRLIRFSCYMRLEKYDLALQDINKVIDINPELPYLYSYRGKLFFLAKQRNKAIEDYKKAIALDVEDTDNYIYLSKLYSQVNKFKESESYLLEAIKIIKESGPELIKREGVFNLNPSEVSVYQEYSRILMLQNNKKKRILVLEEALRRNNGSVDLFDELMLVVSESDGEGKDPEAYKNEFCDTLLIKQSRFCKAS